MTKPRAQTRYQTWFVLISAILVSCNGQRSLAQPSPSARERVERLIAAGNLNKDPDFDEREFEVLVELAPDLLESLTIRWARDLDSQDDDVLSRIDVFKKLKSLHLFVGWLSADELRAIGRLQQLESLEIYFTGPPTKDNRPTHSKSELEAWTQLRQLKNLTNLKIGGTPVDDDVIGQIFPLPNLNTLAVSGKFVSDPSLEQIGKLPQLKSFHLNADEWTANGLAALAISPQLTRLGLASTQFRGWGLEHLKACRSLRHLTLFRCPLEAEAASGLRELDQLTFLSIKGSPDYAISGRLMRSIGQLQSLRSLHLEHVTLIDDDLAGLPGFFHLETLGLTATRDPDESLTNEGLKILGSIVTLQSLGISGLSDSVDVEGIDHLTKLKELRSLAYWSDTLTDEGVETLLKLRRLRSLVLYSDQMTDRAAELMGYFPKLEDLQVNSRNFTQAGWKQVEAVSKQAYARKMQRLDR